MNVLFVLFMALYMTVDGGKILDYAIVFFPLSRQPQARRVMTNIAVRLSHWVVGQLLLALVIGTVAGIGLGLLGVPGAPVLAVIWMVAEFIPGIGPFIAAVPSILLGFLGGANHRHTGDHLHVHLEPGRKQRGHAHDSWAGRSR